MKASVISVRDGVEPRNAPPVAAPRYGAGAGAGAGAPRMEESTAFDAAIEAALAATGADKHQHVSALMAPPPSAPGSEGSYANVNVAAGQTYSASLTVNSAGKAAPPVAPKRGSRQAQDTAV